MIKSREDIMRELSLQQKIGQRLVVGFPGPELDEKLIKLITEYKISNIILFRHNIVNRKQLRELCSTLDNLIRQSTGHKAFITIDEEGGTVSRISDCGIHIPGAMAIAASGKLENAKRAGKIAGKEMKKIGFNFNLAPVMDVNNNANNSVIGVRSYSDKPHVVADYGVEMMKGLIEEGVLAAAKHFPGHGDTEVDSHHGLPSVNKSLEELMEVELVPFQAAIRAGVPAIMTSHILYPQLEMKQIPATMSRTIMQGLLREKLGFTGLIVSDCMEMNAIVEYYGTVPATVAAMKAGVDMVFISHTAELTMQAVEAITAAVQSGELRMEEMDEAVDRILSWKEKANNVINQEISLEIEKEDAEEAYRMLEKSITLVKEPEGGIPKLGDHPFFTGCYHYRATLASNAADHELAFAKEMVKRFGGEAEITEPDPTTEEIDRIVARASEHSCIILGTYNAHMKKGQLELLHRLSELKLPMIVIAMRNPYDLMELMPHVCAIEVWEYSEQSIQAVSEVLSGSKRAQGRLPVLLM
jgi:beta-N-acetylhexosaminidase